MGTVKYTEIDDVPVTTSKVDLLEERIKELESKKFKSGYLKSKFG